MSAFVMRFMRYVPVFRFKLVLAVGVALLALALLLSWFLTRPPASVPASPAGTEAETAANSELTLSPAAIANARIRLAVAGPAILQQSSEFPGRIAVDQHRQLAVAARFNGVLTAMSLHAGQRVRQGDLLARLDSRELAELRLVALSRRKALTEALRLKDQELALQNRVRQLMNLLRAGGDFELLHQRALSLPIGSDKARLLEAYSRLKLSSRQLTRERQLFQDKISSEQEFLQAQQQHESDLNAYSAALEEIARQRENQTRARELDYALAAAEAETSLQQLRALGAGEIAGLSDQNLTRYEIRAPRSGTLIEKRASAGEQVTPETVLYIIADLSEVWAEMQIYENDLPGVKTGMTVTIRSQDGRTRTIGRLAHLRPIIDEVSRSAEAHAEIPNLDGRWFPGMYVSLDLVRSRTPVKVAVEPGALQQIAGKPTVFVRTARGFIPRVVDIGRRGSLVEIRSGLAAGEYYAAANSFVLKSSQLGKD